MELTFVILCGGNSLRMKSDKSLLCYHGVTQREFLYNMLKQISDDVFLSLNKNQNSNLPHIIDDKAFEGHGPISGLLTSMRSFPGKDIIFFGCDYPGASLTDVQQFITSIDRRTPAAFYDPVTGFYEPVLAYYPADCYPLLMDNFNLKMYSLQQFLKERNANKFIPGNPQSMKSIDDPESFEETIMNLKVSSNEILVSRFESGMMTEVKDHIAVEEPLEIKLNWFSGGEFLSKSIAVTMRTPGNDPALAFGFLFTESIIKNANQVKVCLNSAPNEVMVTLFEGCIPELKQADRNFYATSSCGVCGKSSVDLIRVFTGRISSKMTVPAKLVSALPRELIKHQAVFNDTGGLHACALFTNEGKLILMKEDVGRHNALDKLIGSCIQNMELPLDNCILLLSGRASFELIQKAAMSGIPIVAAIGAPSSLAVSLAEECGITLAGFVKEKRINIYTGAQRITN